MNKEDLKRIAIHCPTEEEAIQCCDLANKMGWEWADDVSYKDYNNWEDFRSETCYDFYNGQYGTKEVLKISNYRIESAQWFLDNFKNNMKELEEMKASFDELLKEFRTLKEKIRKNGIYQPEDKELVWAWNDGSIASKCVGFYNAKDNCLFDLDGGRRGYPYKYYAPFEVEYPQWAKDALKKLEE